MNDDYKLYRVNAHYRKPHLKRNIPFIMEIRAKKISEVIERVYSEIGSRHRVKRTEVLIPKDGGIVEIDIKDARSSLFKDVDSEDFVIYN